MVFIYIIDGYSKTLLKDTIQIYLGKNKNKNNTYKFIDIDNFVINNTEGNFLFYNKFLHVDLFIKELYKINFDTLQGLFIFSTSLLDKQLQQYFFENKILKNIFINNQVQYFFLKKKQDLFNLNLFNCTIRITNHLDDLFLYSIASYMLYNYYRCENIQIYYDLHLKNNKIYQKNQFLYQDLFKKIIIDSGNTYDENKMKKILNSYLLKKKIKYISYILIKIFIHIIFYSPSYVFGFYLIKKDKNYLQLSNYKIFLIPTVPLLIPSYMILFIPEIYNFICLKKIIDLKKKKNHKKKYKYKS